MSTQELQPDTQVEMITVTIDGFEVTVRRNLVSYSKDLITSVFFERIINEFKPYLPKE